MLSVGCYSYTETSIREKTSAAGFAVVGAVISSVRYVTKEGLEIQRPKQTEEWKQKMNRHWMVKIG